MDPTLDRTIAQYLNRYASPIAQALIQAIGARLHTMKLAYHSCLCIPAFAEQTPLQQVWEQTKGDPFQSKHLVIILGNWPTTAQASERTTTIESLNLLALEYGAENLACFGSEEIENHGRVSWRLMSGAPSVLLIQPQNGFDPTEGVGLARKIAMDLCLGLHTQGIIENQWVGTTDADARLPANYWERLDGCYHSGLLVFPFTHQFPKSHLLSNDDRRIFNAHRLYESYLRYYVWALSQSMPEFGFHTIGSIFAIHSASYAQVRGYPALAAGEDFYLLNKMVKTAQVTQLTGDPIFLRPRRSQRTPFGTGPSILALLAQSDMKQVPLFYHPEPVRLWTHALLSLRQFDAPKTWSDRIPYSIRAKLEKQYQQCKTKAQKRRTLLSIMDGLRCQQLLRDIHQDTPKLNWVEFNEKQLADSPSRISSSSLQELSVEY